VLWLAVFGEQSQVFSVDPVAYVAICQHNRARLHEDRIPTDVVRMVVCIGQISPAAL
jgi:hypothetical protein